MTRSYLLVLVVACTSSSSTKSPGGSSVTVNGTIGGTPPMLVTAVSQVTTDDKGSLLLVWLSPLADACGAPGVFEPSEASIELALYKAGAGGLVAATDPGAYTTDVTGPGPYAEIDVYDRDASCQPTDAEGKGDGTVTLTTAGNAPAGSFDFTTGSEHVSGTFDAETCAWTDATTCN
ncbi:MAG TPA: hypothetical protein VMJ10_34370 [Kofleriaceae bacterium]|nr:hypothetical protein [Kofleriaceae bacterium]